MANEGRLPKTKFEKSDGDTSRFNLTMFFGGVKLEAAFAGPLRGDIF